MENGSRRLLNEILEQPQHLRKLLVGFPTNFDGIKLPGLFTGKLIGIGEGSSFNALKIAAPFIEEFSGLNNFTFNPESLETKFQLAEYLDIKVKQLFEHSYFLAVSQSGKTSSILSIIERIQETFIYADSHLPMLTFTNNPMGTLSQRYGNFFNIDAGEEQSIAATKTMTGTIMALLLFGIISGQKRGWLRRKTPESLLNKLQTIPAALEKLLHNDSLHHQIEVFSTALASMNQFILLSKGPLSLILSEIGLKLTETSSNLVWTDNTESFKHGPKVILHGVQGHHPNCIYIIPPNLSEKEANQLFADIYSHFYSGQEKVFSTDGVFFTVFENSPVIPDDLKSAMGLTNSAILTLPETEGIESFFIAIVAFQLLSYYLAIAKGEDPNNPALQKAVTH